MVQEKCKILFNLDEIKKNKYEIKTKIPQEKKCPYCKNILETKGILNLKDNCIYTFITNEKCTCNKAIEERRKLQQERNQKEKEEFEKLRREILNKKIKQYYGSEFITEIFKRKILNNFIVSNENIRTKQAAEKFIKNFNVMKKGIMFVGKNGTGKTYISIAIANELIKQNIPVIFGTLSNLLDKYKLGYENNNDIELTKLYTKVDLLIIDDLGTEFINEWMLSKLFEIINGRMLNELPIIVTTNYSIERLRERLTIKNKPIEITNSIISRLYCMCYKVECKGEDYRMIKNCK